MWVSLLPARHYVCVAVQLGARQVVGQDVVHAAAVASVNADVVR